MMEAQTCRPEQACVRIATSKRDLSKAFSLVYERYVEANLVERNTAELRVVRQHALPTTEVMIACHGDDVIGTATLILDNVLGLPMEAAYASEVESRRNDRQTLAEISCLADQKGKISRQTLIDLMAFAVQCAKRRGVDRILIAVHPRHVGFYTRCLGFEVFAGLRRYLCVRGKPAIGLCLELNELEIRSPVGYRRLFGRPYTSDQLSYRPLSSEARLYVQRSLQAIESPNFESRPAALAS